MSKILLSLSLLAIFMTSTVQSQDVLLVYGVCTDYHLGDVMPLVDVVITKDSVEFKTVKTGNTGRYEVALDLGHQYQFFFERNGYFAKNYIIDSRGLTEKQQDGGFTFDVDMSMIPESKGLILEMAAEPISVASYDKESDMLQFDRKMAEQYSTKVEKAMTKFQKRKK